MKNVRLVQPLLYIRHNKINVPLKQKCSMKTGHVKQVAAFEQLLGYCNAQGAGYNPSKVSMKMTALNTMLTQAQQSLQAVDAARNSLLDAIHQRQKAFRTVPQFATRIVNILRTTEVSPERISEANAIRRKFYQKSDTRQVVLPVTAPEIPGQEIPKKSRGAAYADFDSKLALFSSLVQLLAAEPLYKPNEAELQIANLNAMLTNLRSRTKAVVTAQVNFKNAIANRNKVLYGATSIQTTSAEVKSYMKGVFGVRSNVFLQVNKINFTKAVA
jgi:hypothetical protein